jgi:hypothetical protein
VFLEHLDASIGQAGQIMGNAEEIMVLASLIAIARIARHARPACTDVTFTECDDEGCGHFQVTGWVTDDEDTEETEHLIKLYAINVRRCNDAIWGPYVTEVPPDRLPGATLLVLDIARALAIPQPPSQLGYTRGEVKYGAGQTPGRPGQPSPTRYFPVDFGPAS